MRAITISVEFSDLLEITLPRNRHHFTSYTVVTSPSDYNEVKQIATAHDADVIVSDLFHANGCYFNKWLPLENALDQIGREGVLCLLDADVLWPKDIQSYEIHRGYLYVPRRRLCPLPLPSTGVPQETDWGAYYRSREREFAGYSQIFHADDPNLGAPPWHETNWLHAGGADSFFQMKWPESHKRRPPFEVLHLGDMGRNWCGRADPYTNGQMPEKAKERYSALREFVAGRRELVSQGKDRYSGEKIS